MTLIVKPELERVTGGDMELLGDLAEMFVQSLPDLERRVRDALQSDGVDEISMIAHQLRSRVSYFGAVSLQEIAKGIENEARNGELSTLVQPCDELFAGIDELLVELRELTTLSLEKSDATS